MRPRSELAAGLGLLLLLGLLVAALERRDARGQPSLDPRHSSFLTTPEGVRGLAEALEHLGVRVERYRRRTGFIHEWLDSGDTAGGAWTVPLFALLDPFSRLTGVEAEDVVSLSTRADLLLAGRGAAPAMRCFGFNVENRLRDSVQAVLPGHHAGLATPWVQAVLAASSDTLVTDSSAFTDAESTRCAVARMRSADTLLVSPGGRLVAIRLHLEDPRGVVILVSDGRLFSNRLVRRTEAGPFALGLIAPRYRRVAFDEYHQGFGSSGSLLRATLGWSFRSPWGWAAWQAILVGLLALLAGGVRFGPIRQVINRRRRSPLEHVRALATALAATQGHDVAVSAIIQGLRRRLLHPGQPARGDWQAWLGQLESNARTPRARSAARTLASLTAPHQPAISVLEAANAVEDVWQELKP